MYQAFDTKRKIYVALKRIKNSEHGSAGQESSGNCQVEKETTGMPHYILREISALLDLRGHTNIIELLDVFTMRDSKNVILSFAYERGGDLCSIMTKNRQL